MKTVWFLVVVPARTKLNFGTRAVLNGIEILAKGSQHSESKVEVAAVGVVVKL